MKSQTYQFEGPRGVATVGADLAQVLRRDPQYSEILPETPPPGPDPEDETPARTTKEK